jgi:hypothetical protein
MKINMAGHKNTLCHVENEKIDMAEHVFMPCHIEKGERTQRGG